jgi:YD repeat-containing protein
MAYDAAGNLVSTSDARCNETVNAYDGRGRLVSTTQPD